MSKTKKSIEQKIYEDITKSAENKINQLLRTNPCQICAEEPLEADSIAFNICGDCRDNHSDLESLLYAALNAPGAA